MANANLLLTFSIDTRTEDELCYAREQSVIPRGEVRKLKTELEKEKQDHKKTLKELKELKMLHETLKTENQELPKTIQQQRGE